MGKSKKTKTSRDYNTGPLSTPLFAPQSSIFESYAPAFVPSHHHEEMRFRIGPACGAHIIFEGAVTQEAVRKLIAYLEMSVESFPEKIKN
jgi:hypothetical protein